MMTPLVATRREAEPLERGEACQRRQVTELRTPGEVELLDLEAFQL
jgi:hypothetical protein